MATSEITAKQAQKMLEEKGLILNEEQTELVLDFLRLIAGIVVEKHIRDENTKSSNLQEGNENVPFCR